MNISSVPLVVPLTIDDLPPEILDRILSHLGIRDIGRCMMVSKRWNSIGRNLKINEMIFKKTDRYHTMFDHWITKEMFDQKMVLSESCISKPLPLNTTFLTRLYLYSNATHNFGLVQLNKFVHLEHLELRNFNRESQPGITFLNLPNLKILNCSIVDCNLVFNTPALNTVYISASSKVRFRNLPMLQLFEKDFSYVDYNYCKFNRIKSVNVFRTEYNRNLHIICEVLKQLSVNEVRFCFSLLANSISREYFEKWLPLILEQRRILNKKYVKIYIFDILLEDGKTFDEYGFENVVHLHVR